MFLVLGSTLSMLLAIDTGRSRYWVLYAVCSAGAFYTHYTCVFVLGAQLVWVLWTEPRLRRVALFSNAGAALLVAPWIPGLIADARSPTVKILSALSAFSVHAVRLDIEHWAIGHPYAQLAIPNSTATGLRQVPGIPALILLALAGLVTAGGLAHRRAAIRPTRRAVLVVALMLATGVGECVFSAVGDHIIGVRDMAASWPFLALSAAAVVVAAGRWVAVAAGILTVGAFAIAASKMFVPRFERPDYQGAAAYVAARASARDVAIDETGYLVTPGPLTGFDVAFRGRPAVLRARAPAERDHPFSVFDRAVPLHAAESQAARQAVGGRIFVIGPTVPSAPFPGDYHLVAVRRYAGLEQLIVSEWSRSATAER
jgi:4-amino-4-deoxy-L-arabinose transferase-like glycosyltransferase